jgi:hypothetical protein
MKSLNLKLLDQVNLQGVNKVAARLLGHGIFYRYGKEGYYYMDSKDDVTSNKIYGLHSNNVGVYRAEHWPLSMWIQEMQNTWTEMNK